MTPAKMSREFALELTISLLERARDAARAAGMGPHFQSEVGHLLATARANRGGERASEGIAAK